MIEKNRVLCHYEYLPDFISHYVIKDNMGQVKLPKVLLKKKLPIVYIAEFDALCSHCLHQVDLIQKNNAHSDFKLVVGV